LIGSDISIRAIETASKNIQFAKINEITKDVLDMNTHSVINEPLIYAKHWPNSEESNGLIDFSMKS
jgi:hypothetical protein